MNVVALGLSLSLDEALEDPETRDLVGWTASLAAKSLTAAEALPLSPAAWEVKLQLHAWMAFSSKIRKAPPNSHVDHCPGQAGVPSFSGIVQSCDDWGRSGAARPPTCTCPSPPSSPWDFLTCILFLVDLTLLRRLGWGGSLRRSLLCMFWCGPGEVRLFPLQETNRCVPARKWMRQMNEGGFMRECEHLWSKLCDQVKPSTAPPPTIFLPVGVWGDLCSACFDVAPAKSGFFPLQETNRFVPARKDERTCPGRQFEWDKWIYFITYVYFQMWSQWLFFWQNGT